MKEIMQQNLVRDVDHGVKPIESFTNDQTQSYLIWYFFLLFLVIVDDLRRDDKVDGEWRRPRLGEELPPAPVVLLLQLTTLLQRALQAALLTGSFHNMLVDNMLFNTMLANTLLVHNMLVYKIGRGRGRVVLWQLPLCGTVGPQWRGRSSGISEDHCQTLLICTRVAPKN